MRSAFYGASIRPQSKMWPHVLHRRQTTSSLNSFLFVVLFLVVSLFGLCSCGFVFLLFDGPPGQGVCYLPARRSSCSRPASISLARQGGPSLGCRQLAQVRTP